MTSCEHCKNNTVKRLRCGACNQVFYCSKNCQIAHWKLAHKKECKQWKKFDDLMFQIAENEKTGFMECKTFEEEFVATDTIPALLSFANPQRYLNNIIDYKANNVNNKFKAAHISPCQEVHGIIKYLSKCASADPMSFFDSFQEKEKAKQQIYQFISKENKKSEFSALFVLMGLSQYTCSSKIHYWTVIKLHNKFRVIQSFGCKKSLTQQLKSTSWMNRAEILTIVDAFLYLESVGISTDITDREEADNKIRESSIYCLGFELKAEKAEKSARDKENIGNHQTLFASVMNDLSFKRFSDASNHLLGYFRVMFNKFEANEFNDKGVPLCYRIGFPLCLDEQYLKRINIWGYKLK